MMLVRPRFNEVGCRVPATKKEFVDMGKYGDFDNQNREYVITQPDTPRAWDNYIWNDAYYRYVDQLGKGYSRYQTQEGHQTQLLFGAHNNPQDSRLLYIRDEERGVYWNIGWDPVQRTPDSYQCRHGLGYTIIENQTQGIRATDRIFVPPGNDPVEYWSVTLKNESDQTRTLSVFTYAEMSLAGARTYGHMMFMSGHFYPELNAVIARKRAEGMPTTKYAAFLASDVKPESFDASQRTFLGPYRRVANPIAVEQGKCFNSVGTGEPVVGCLQIKMQLQPGEEQTITFLLGVTDNVKPAEETKRLLDLYLSKEKADQKFAELKADKEKRFSTVWVDTPDEHLNSLTNIWNKQQVDWGATWVRWGIKGYRDILQQAQGITVVDPELCKKDFLDACCFQYADGFALRGWDPVDKMAYADSAQWMIGTITEYVRETGDFAVLDQVVPYFDKGEDTVFEHMLKALRKLHSDRGEHGLSLIHFGDWNDSLTAVGTGGRGESVWLSMAFARSCLLLSELAKQIKKQDVAQELDAMYMEIKQNINEHAWDGEYYICAYDDNGRAIGSRQNKEGKIFLNMQSWAALSGVAEGGRLDQCLAAIEKELDSGYGFVLQKPVYTEFDPNIGRLTNLEPGICENATVYSHGNAFLILGYLTVGRSDKAYSAYRSILPENPNNPSNTAVPYVFPNAYFGPDHKSSPGRIEYSWITGSCAWIFQSVLEYMLGVRRDYEGLRFDPRLPSEWPLARVTRVFRGDTYEVEIENPKGVQTGVKELLVDGKSVDPKSVVKPFGDGKVHTVKVVMG